MATPRTCSECTNPCPPSKGRPRETCSPACAKARLDRMVREMNEDRKRLRRRGRETCPHCGQLMPKDQIDDYRAADERIRQAIATGRMTKEDEV